MHNFFKGNIFGAVLFIILLSSSVTHGAILADSVNDWQTAFTNDGTLNQGEFGWEYGYISNFTGSDGEFYGWHQSTFYWEKGSDIKIFWPEGQTPPDVTWGQGGDSTGSRPPMCWADGAYSWAGDMNNQWAATRRWVSDYTGTIDITGKVGRHYDPYTVLGWDVMFVVAINAQTLYSPAIHTRTLVWDDAGLYDIFISNIPVKQGDTVDFLCIPLTGNSHNGYIKTKMIISEHEPLPSSDLNDDGIVNLKDFVIFASFWQSNDCGNSNWCGGTDFNQDSRTDYVDLTIFAYNWLNPTLPKGSL